MLNDVECGTGVPACESPAQPRGRLCQHELRGLLYLSHEHLRRTALPDAGRARLVVEIFGKTRLHGHHLSRVTGDVDRLSRVMVRLGHALLNGAYLVVVTTLPLSMLI